MTPEELLDSARVFALPLHREFRGVTVREGLLFEGPSGWAEFAPFLDHTDAHAGRWLAAAIEQAYGTWPPPLRARVPVNAIIPMTDAVTTGELTRAALASGCTTVKTKVGADDPANDVARVATIRAVLDEAGVRGRIRIDTNQRWSAAQAIALLPELDAVAGGLEYVEQPVAGRDALRAVRAAVDVPIAVDEGIRLATDPVAAVAALREVADVAVLKAIPLGGVRPALAVAEAAGLPVVVSGSLDTVVGLASGLWLAACLPNLAGACGLGTGALLRHDVVASPQPIVDGHLRVERVVPEDPDPAGLVDDAMRTRWRERLLRAWEHAGMDRGVGA